MTMSAYTDWASQPAVVTVSLLVNVIFLLWICTRRRP